MIGRAVRHRTALPGDPDPMSAGTAGDAALWGGSIAVVGMTANPLGAHQASTDMLAETNLEHAEIVTLATACSLFSA